MTDSFFQTRGLTAGYGGRPVISDVSISLRKGEIVALIGPNGSGKSTLLKSAARQLRAVKGEVWLDGRELRALTRQEISRKMAVALTERVRTELLTCLDVVAAGRYPYTGRLGVLKSEDLRKAEHALSAVGALELADSDFSRLSDGQRQRVLLARALCQEPEFLVLDEPTSFLDIHCKLELLGILRRMARETGLTVLLSLHEIDLAEKLADRILCVKEGAVFAFGTPEEVFREDAVRELYEMRQGFFDPLFGSVEMARVPGAPRAFVLSSCGTGIPVYRALQREGLPFSAGILYTNDVDFHVARLLATEVVAEEPFQEIGDDAWRHACALLDACEWTLDAGVAIGACNRRMTMLLERAKALNKYRDAREFLAALK